MATKKAGPSSIRYLYGTVTQGSADAFKELDIPTGLSNLSNFAYRIREVAWEMVTGGTAVATYELALTQVTQASMPTLATRSLINKWMWSVSLTTSGAFIFDHMANRIQYSSEDNVLVVTESLYAQMDSASSSASNSARIRIAYEVVELAEIERLNILNAISLGF